MRQITGRMTGTEIQIEMEIQALRTRVSALEDALRDLRAEFGARGSAAVPAQVEPTPAREEQPTP